MKNIIWILLLANLFAIACQRATRDGSNNKGNKQIVKRLDNSESSNIPFTLVNNYFVRNSVEQLDHPRIESKEKFNEVFGMATTMGKDGKPTEIDFDKQYVIAVVLPETDSLTTLAPLSLQRDAQGTIILSYKRIVGPKLSYSLRPSFEIVVNKSEQGSIVLKEIR